MTLPSHLFVSSTDGGLYDTRLANWSAAPALRTVFSRHCRTIESVAEFKACLRAGQYAWPGGYQLFFLTDDGATISFDGARASMRQIVDSIQNRSRDGWRVVACDINHEDSEMVCEVTGKPIPSAYGDDDATAPA